MYRTKSGISWNKQCASSKNLSTESLMEKEAGRVEELEVLIIEVYQVNYRFLAFPVRR